MGVKYWVAFSFVCIICTVIETNLDLQHLTTACEDLLFGLTCVGAVSFSLKVLRFTVHQLFRAYHH